MEIEYGQLENLNWLWLVAVIGIGVACATVWHRRALMEFATPNLLDKIVDRFGLAKKLISFALSITALIAIVVALIDIRWGKTWREVPQKGIEVIFALDVSRSMLAKDATPNRLDRAKQGIKDMVSEMAGDRVGLVLFAGDVRQHVPLTNHYEDFKQSLDEIGPHNIERGGSNLGEAIRVASRSFLEKTADHKAIVLITDGEDHESRPVEAAKEAYEQSGVRIFTVGLGDLQQGARIPAQTRRGESFVEHQGQQVWSKLDGKILEEIASSSSGAYIPAGTKRVDMGAVYHRFIAGIDQQDFATAKINTYIPRYHWFLGIALGLLFLEFLTSHWPRRIASNVAASPFSSGIETGSDANRSQGNVLNKPAAKPKLKPKLKPNSKTEAA